ncbi:hypothetical protein CYMTET_23447 [Cymbomonas tetramitiformis]|uniref:Uncharacterized protein n=1 Tax=Cymbomonas tetramitiformis TaxID=36881 RepID=A0AAE0L170_9CHLO|nr:hypothetical protein CYMTET_23447 [Cymbomonas tetramitiformis]
MHLQAGSVPIFAAIILQFALPCLSHEPIPVGDSAPVYTVPTVSHAKLLDAANFVDSDSMHVLKDALTNQGLVTVSDIPGFAELRREVLVGMHVCGSAATKARTTVFEDGTSRNTLATIAKGDGELIDIDIGKAAYGACTASLMKKVSEFRSLVSATAKAFTERLDDALRSQYLYTEGKPLLWNYDHSRSYDTMADVVGNAEHLEHFHSYYRPVASNDTAESVAIDLHADQGIFIAFTPGILVEEVSNGEIRDTSKPAGKFYVSLRDGTPAVAKFGQGGDVLVFMLGDGVDQYINPKLSSGPYLRATPHAMVMPQHGEKEWRAWYGRMFLPPSDALSEKHGLSFGQLRERMIDGVHKGKGVGSGVGCSRMLQETDEECGDNQMYCWMRCMDYTEEASPLICAAATNADGLALNLQVQCTSQFDQIYRRGIDTHGDYNPICTNSTENITAAPSIADSDWAQNTPYTESCSDAAWETFLSKSEYTNSLNLKTDGDDGYGALYLLYTVQGNQLKGKMAYRGVAGWLAFGPENHGGGHNGMNGAHIVMGTYDPDPTIDEPLFEPIYVGTTVAEYIINDDTSAFRTWKTPVSPGSVSDSEMLVEGGCFTGMTFTADGAIAKDALNMTGANSFIWGVHTASFYKNYHGYTNRGHLCLDFCSELGHQNFVSPFSPDQPATLQACSYSDYTTCEVTSNDCNDYGVACSNVAPRLGHLQLFAIAMLACLAHHLVR